MPPHYGALAASPRRPAAPIDIRRLYVGTIVPALSCTPLGPRFAELLAKAPEGPTRAAACERELGAIWRAADWRRHVLETRRCRGHALGKRPSLRALSGAGSPPLVSLVCPPPHGRCPNTRPVPLHPLFQARGGRGPSRAVARPPQCAAPRRSARTGAALLWSGVRVCCLLCRCLGPKAAAVGFATKI